MFRQIFVKIFFPSALALLVTSCGSGGGGFGSGNLGGNITEFKTSYAYATASTPRLEADLVTGNSCTATGWPGDGTIITESVDISINTVSTAKGGATPLPISIDGYNVYFTPKNAGYPTYAQLTRLSNPYTAIINPGGSLKLPVAVITEQLKRDLILADPFFPCSLNIYQYDVTVVINATEAQGEVKAITASFVMSLADRNNQ